MLLTLLLVLTALGTTVYMATVDPDGAPKPIGEQRRVEIRKGLAKLYRARRAARLHQHRRPPHQS